MTSINSHIAASAAQTALQQSQVARSQDAQRNEAARNAERMRQLLRKHLESVEDSYETSDHHMVIDEQAGNGQRPHGEPMDQQSSQRSPAPPENADAPPDAADPGSDPGPGHVDVTA